MMDSTHYFSSSDRILLIGAANLDIVGRPEQPPATGISTEGRIYTSFGGVARNVAENLARLGQSVTLLTVVGQDTIGENLLKETTAAGVDTSACIISHSAPTAAYVAVLDMQGELHVALDDMRILSALSPEIILANVALFEDAQAVFVDANLSTENLKTIFQTCQSLDIPVFADATTWSLAIRLKSHLHELYFLNANRNETAEICPNCPVIHDQTSAIQAARHLVSMGLKIAVIPLGEMGVCYATSETSGHIPAIKTQILNPTGAGDALTAAIIYGLVNHMEMDEALRLGVSAASLTLRDANTVLSDLTLEKLYDELVI